MDHYQRPDSAHLHMQCLFEIGQCGIRIGNHAILARHGIATLVHLPGVGENLATTSIRASGSAPASGAP